MNARIFGALAEFNGHLVANIGKPIGLGVFSAFNKLVQEILAALQEG